MKTNKIITTVLSILLASCVSFAAPACVYGVSAPEPAEATALADSSADGRIDYAGGSFQSHLPLVILEGTGLDVAPGDKPGAASMRVVDTGADNSPDGDARYEADILLGAIMYENDDPRPKKDYFISEADAAGQGSQGAPLPGLDARDNWFLLGGAYDKSLIRNYLGYTLAKRVLPDAPSVRLCELLLKDGGEYDYRGVYLLVEGYDAAGSVAARRTEHYWEGFNQVVVSNGYAGVFVLQEGWGSGADTVSMGRAIERVSGMFNSSDTNQYLRYGEVLELESFYAYFLINELMANYEGMSESIYTYNPATQKLSIGPVWNFERALDNRKYEAVNLRRLEYQGTPFYSHMIRDSEFVNGLINIAKENAATLRGEEIVWLIEAAVAEIGDAAERDRLKWQDFYHGEEAALRPYAPTASSPRIGANGIGYDENGALMIETAAYYILPENAPMRKRQFETYEQEIVKLKFYANARPAFVRRAILLLKNQDELLTSVNSYGQNSLWAILFLAGFFLSIILARRTAEQ